jgi:enoyl-CoA hydratase
MSNEVLFTEEGPIGLITLNRPNALNALSLAMILGLQQQLNLWAGNESIKAIVIRAGSDGAFCAGGDVRSLYHAGKSNLTEQMSFFWHEYHLNQFIHQLNKPYIALMDGITMGGGVGISLHGSHPIASERFVFAMPETGIGFFPDIGASYLLNRCRGSWGRYLGLTGNRMHVPEAMHCGLLRHHVRTEHMGSLLEALIASDLSIDAYQRVDACINTFATAIPYQELPEQSLIDTCFAPETIEEIHTALTRACTPWAEDMNHTLAKKSPLSLKVTLAQLQKTQGLSLERCLALDYVLVRHFMEGIDFYEGIRALLIDKDKSPQWCPAYLDEVSEDLVRSYFEEDVESISIKFV